MVYIIEGTKSHIAQKIPIPINQFPDGTQAISSRMCKQILKGLGFSASELMLTEGTNFIMNLTNTSASAEDICVRFLWHETK